MNLTIYGALWLQTAYGANVVVAKARRSEALESIWHIVDVHLKTIERTYVINLDRETGRWERMRRELNQLLDHSEDPYWRRPRVFSDRRKALQ